MKTIRLPARRPPLTAAAPEPGARHVPRAALAALAAIAAASGLLLSGAGPASAFPIPPAPNPELAGIWANTNTTNPLIKDLVFTEPGVLSVGEFDNCGGGAACDADPIPVTATVFGSDIKSATGNSFTVTIDHATYDETLFGTFTPAPPNMPGAVPTLTVREFTTELGGSVPNSFSTETFTPGPQFPYMAGSGDGGITTLGVPAPPVEGLAGIWLNTNKASRGVTAIEITKNGVPNQSPLSVDVFGTCDPQPCDWGPSTSGSTYGAVVNGSLGTSFLAFHNLAFKNTTVSGTISADGKTLTVSTYSEFTDGTGRSNYVLNDTFTRS